MQLSEKTLSPLICRPRRLRMHPVLRELVKETHLTKHDFILPLFIKGMLGHKKEIPSLPGHFQIPLSQLEREIDELLNLGIKSIILFGVPSYKDSWGSDACHSGGIIQQALQIIKKCSSEILAICDVCFCEYTDHGHCGILSEKNSLEIVDNDTTLIRLSEQAVSLARAGADILAPSGMMDGAVSAIRAALDDAQFYHIPIMSYTVKYHSALYGPFRIAAEGSPSFGSRASHQMDFCNRNEALKEVTLDEKEGADILMVKPAHAYLDIIYQIKTQTKLPLAAYHTSGEYMMIKSASEKGYLDERNGALEILTSIKRAGADMIISYYTKEIFSKKWLQ